MTTKEQRRKHNQLYRAKKTGKFKWYTPKDDPELFAPIDRAPKSVGLKVVIVAP